MKKVFWLRLIAGLGCSGSAVLVVLLCVVAVVVAKMQEDPLGILPACGPANPAGPDLLSNAPKPSPKTTGPTAYPAAYTVGPASRPSGGETVQNVALTRADAANSIPSDYVTYYKAAGTKYGISWSVLAGVGKIESDHGRSTLTGVKSGENGAHAAGPMQFIPDTWKTYGTKDIKDRYNPALAIPAAAKYLKALGVATNPRRALWHYNGAAHSSWGYADRVLSWAKRYDQNLSLGPANPFQASCGGGFGAGGSYAPGSTCPSSGGMVAGHITRRMACVRDQIKAKFKVPRGIGCYRANGGIPGGGEHPLGRACDFMISSGSPKPDEVQLGYDIANWAKANAKRLGIDYIIYRQHIWNPLRASEGWRQMEDRGGLTANHYDHVHISVLASTSKA